MECLAEEGLVFEDFLQKASFEISGFSRSTRGGDVNIPPRKDW